MQRKYLIPAIGILGLAIAGLEWARIGGGKVEVPLAKGTADWPSYGGDPGGTRYSKLSQINRQNVGQLEVAWTYRTGDVSDGSRWRQKSAFEATPILVDGVMYLPTPFNRVIALDPETGRDRWAFDPHLDKNRPGGDGFVCRGVATWLDPAKAPGDACRRRIFEATLDARLIAVDAATGKPCPDFGAGGEVALAKDVGEQEPGEYHITSPPAVVGENVVVGSAINDNGRVDMPRGVVRAYNARTGALAWSWDPIPRRTTDPGRETWAGDSANKTGAGNAWSILSADDERDLVFVPTGSASVDHYGGERLGNNLFANCIVALHGSTGKIAWYFQVVHHDLWDYDVPAQPVLISLKGAPALVQATKMGMLFVLNRETGVPVFRVEERAVPASDTPGEQASPTQPFPVAPPPLAPQRLQPEDAWGLTPFDRAGCRDRIASARSEGIFTPPSLRGAVDIPGLIGGTNWGSLAYDPERSLAVVNASNLPFLVGLVPREKFAEAEKLHPKAEWARMKGTPYMMWRKPIVSGLRLPCVAPPWGTLSGVDLATGRIRWQVPLGTIRDIAPIPLPIPVGTPSLGGPIATAGGLTFIAAAMDNYLRAFDSDTGKELWKARLPAGAQATPMTYQVHDNGKQYVVIAAGGHGKLGTKLGDYVIAFALP